MINVLVFSSAQGITELFNELFSIFKRSAKKYSETKMVEINPSIISRTILFETSPSDYIVSIDFVNSKDEKEKKVNSDCKNFCLMLALFDHCSKLKHLPKSHLTKTFFCPNIIHQHFQVDEDLNCLIKHLVFDESNEILECKLQLISRGRTVGEIIKWIEGVNNEFEFSKQNELNNRPCIFKTSTSGSSNGRVGSSRAEMEMFYEGLPGFPTFTMTNFYSNKDMDNVFGKAATNIRKRVEFFSKNKEWYKKKGIPYHLTCMLSGKPGTGKSSILKACANHLDRHIINVDFNLIKTSKQLNNLFDSEYIYHQPGDKGDLKKIRIPMEKRLYVIEEIDTLGDIVMERSTSQTEPVKGQLNLGDILNILDGNNEYPGRIIMITTNCLDKLDKALTRSGRMDTKQEFENPSNTEISDYINNFFEEDLGFPDLHPVCKRLVSYADVCRVCFENQSDRNIQEIAESLIFIANEAESKEEVKPAETKEDVKPVVEQVKPKEDVKPVVEQVKPKETPEPVVKPVKAKDNPEQVKARMTVMGIEPGMSMFGAAMGMEIEEENHAHLYK
jgi:AAA+ superfamily predicted ATPase